MKKFRITLLALLVVALIVAIVYYLVNHTIVVMEPEGMIGKKERDLFIDASLLMLIVVVPAIVLTLIFAWKYRASNKKAKYSPDWERHPVGEAIWWGVPCLIIVILGIITWNTTHELNPFKPIETEQEPLTVQVVALEWKWLFLYPEEGVASLNWVQFPENRPVRFLITADAPMNSFWIPQLGGQIYAMPAMRSELNLVADQVGDYRGFSSNISGKGFAGMQFTARSSTKEDFENWVLEAKKSDKSLNFEEYLELVKPSEYVPVALYNLPDIDLFEQIIDQYKPKGK